MKHRALTLVFVGIVWLTSTQLLATDSRLDSEEAAVQDDGEPVVIAISIGEEQYQSELGNYLYNKTVSLLSKQDRISFVDRSQMQSIMEEQHLQLSGFANTFDIIRFGKLKVAQYILDLKAGKLEKDVSIAFALADTSTGETVYQKEFSGSFKNLDLPVFILCDAVALKTTGESIPPPDEVQIVTVSSTTFTDFGYKALSDGKERDGIMYVQGDAVLLSGDKLVVQFFVGEDCVFGFPVPADLQSFEFVLEELPKHRYEAMMRDINLKKLSPFQEDAMRNYRLYGLLVFDMWVYRDMSQGDIATFMNLKKEVIELFAAEFNDIETRLYGE